jgi:hypothetical protein
MILQVEYDYIQLLVLIIQYIFPRDSCKSQCFNHKIDQMAFFFIVLRFELRASFLLGSCSTT